jgi:hypothetical protein
MSVPRSQIGIGRSNTLGAAEATLGACVKMWNVHAAVCQAKARAGVAEELAPRIKEEAIPIISGAPGLRARATGSTGEVVALGFW